MLSKNHKKFISKLVDSLAILLIVAFILISFIDFFGDKKNNPRGANDEDDDLYKKRMDSLRQEFVELVDKHCRVTDINLPLDCLTNLKEFDSKADAVLPVDKCDRCKTTHGTKTTFLHHTYVNARKDGDEKRIISLSRLHIASFLSTQNLCCTRLWVWTLPEFYPKLSASVNKTFSHYITNRNIQIKELRVKELCHIETKWDMLNSSFRHHPICNHCTKDTSLSGSNQISLSDFVRFFVLDIFGGIYSDLDVLYLKDTFLLWNENFAYRWSQQSYLNTAVLGINKYTNPEINKVFKDLISRCLTINELASNLHPHRFSNMLRILELGQKMFTFKTIKSYSTHLFDPAWPCHDELRNRTSLDIVCSFVDFYHTSSYNIQSPRDFFPGAFTYHIHSSKATPEKNSLFRRFESFYTQSLKLNY